MFTVLFTHLYALFTVIYVQLNFRDLLKPNNSAPLELREKEKVGVYVPNLHSVLCKNVDDMITVMNQGNKNITVRNLK